MADPTPTPTPTPAPAGTPWFQGMEGVDAEFTGYLTNRGWDKLDAPKAAFEAAKAHRELHKLHGVTADRLIRLPEKLDDPEAMAPVWQRLGKPTDAKDYDFSAIKFKDGTEIDQTFADTMRATLFKLNVPKDAAPQIVREIVNQIDAAEANDAAERASSLAADKQALEKSWGANAAANRLIAQNALRALLPASGMSPDKFAEAMSAMESVVGYAGLHNILLTIGQKIGEDKFIGGHGVNNDGVMSKEQAQARINELKADKDWVGRWMKGGSAEKREFDNLTRLIAG